MNNFFATIYETIFGLYDSQFSRIFDTLYDNGGYNLLGITFIFIPLIMFAGFYFLWRYPYGKIWHWFLWLIIAFLITSSISWGISNNEIFLSDNQALIDALSDPETRYEEYANTLTIKHAFFNGLLSIASGFIWSLLLKPFSKIQIHLPF